MANIKDKERILKAAREKQQVTYKGIPIRLSADFSAETLHARRKWHNIFKVMKGINLKPRILSGFSGGAVVKNPPANAGDTGLSPGPGRYHMPRSR